MSPFSLRFHLTYWLAATFALVVLAGCALERPPTLDEVRSGRAGGRVAEDTAVQPGESQGEVLEIDQARREVRVQPDVGGRRVLLYDRPGTRVMYHDWDYPVEQLESGDIIAFRTRPRGDEIETIRIEIPVQARRGPIASRGPRPPKSDVVEGTVERIQLDSGLFEIQPRSGRMVTVSVPYNARPADIDSFRRLRTGDYVRVEGEFTNPDNLQLLSFLPPR